MIINTVSGKRYIGSSKNVRLRWNSHICLLRKNMHPSPHLQASWNHHGASCFSVKFVLICSPEHCVMYEQKAIDALSPEYNYAPVAGSRLGQKSSNETLAKLSKMRKGVKLTEERKRKLLEGAEKRRKLGFTQETIERMKLKAKGNTRRRGYIEPEHVRKKISLARRGLATRGRSVCSLITGESYRSIAEAARKLGIKRSTLGAQVRRQIKTNIFGIEYV